MQCSKFSGIKLAIRTNYNKPGYGQRCADYASGLEHDGYWNTFNTKPDEYTEEQSQPDKKADVDPVGPLTSLTYPIGEFSVELIYLQ